MRLLNDVTETIGYTPMVNLSRITKSFGTEGHIFAKLEYLNPAESSLNARGYLQVSHPEQTYVLPLNYYPLLKKGKILW
ncbi:hypothetical protein [Desulfosporosinus shakirovi]|uniref:hypothetical protein n=1 Tax=Desulfosporosinus shakirovi TaxID=2885154 RepID=UPI001E2F98E7|nr:hypothetical protein [Desulfosporosinus sp. SRJS8]MCB8815299.1 hypothetical protein [Desulfosporosinus sp. SRJS8]